MEGHLSIGVTDLLAKSASLTAELMAARLEQVAASGSSLVSEVSATVAAGRGKVTDVLSRFALILAHCFCVMELWFRIRSDPNFSSDVDPEYIIFSNAKFKRVQFSCSKESLFRRIYSISRLSIKVRFLPNFGSKTA